MIVRPELGIFALALLASTTACTEGAGSVTRMSGGVRYEGRFIAPEAYAAYTLGIEHETRGEYAKAVTAYVEARASDPESPEIWARIGACQCFGSSPERGPAAGMRAFDNGIELDSDYYGNYFERARCAERARDFDTALEDAREAVLRRPEDEPANLLVARLLQARGRRAEARAWLEAFESFHEASPAMHRALAAARAPLRAVEQQAEASPHQARSAAFAELRTGKLEAARTLAQTELDADPTNADAWVATLVACDALRDDACFDAALDELRSPALTPTDTAVAFLNELLARRAGAHFMR